MRKKKGFSLIVVLIVLALIAIFTMCAYSLMLQYYKKTYDNTKYDVKMIIQKNTSGNSNEVATVEVIDKNKNLILSTENPKLQPKVLLNGEKYNIEITVKSSDIYLNLKDSYNNLVDSWQIVNNMDYSDKTVILQMDTEINVNLCIKGNNEMGDNVLYVYFAKIKNILDTNESIRYSFQNDGGIIQTYCNVYKK